MADKPATIRDVARRAGVSPATVSNVMGSRKPVAENLVKRVRQAASDLNYEADRAASQLRSGKAKVVAVLVPDLDNPFFTSIVSAVEACLRAESYEVIVASSNGEEAVENSRLAAMLAWRPAGLVVIPSSDRFTGRMLVQRSGVPYVIADRVTDGLPADTVSVDNAEAGAIGARHLVERGHTRIMVAASSLALANIRERCAGAAELMRRHGLPAPDLVELGFDFETASQRLARWFAAHEPPTAVLALTNFTTLGMLATIAERGLTLPRDISLIGFDDYAWMRARATPLTAISQPVREMGRAIWERLSARIGGDLSEPRRVLLSCELVVRASTASLAGGRSIHASQSPREADARASGGSAATTTGTGPPPA